MIKKIIITGASGFIGNKLLNFFLQKKYDVIGWDQKKADNSDYVKLVDMSNVIHIKQQLSEFRPDLIIHCAGSADVGFSVREPYADYDGNVTLTHNLLFAANELEMADTRFVFLSSAGVYGNPAVLPIKEDARMNPLSPYALHKVMCEEICFFFIRNYSFDIKIARIFSAYGAGLKKQIFWDMHKKIEETGQLNMFGTGNESRDYIHIDDVVQALYLIATCNSDEVVFNVANGQETTIRQATELFAEYSCIGKDKIKFNGYIREGDPINWRADISKISALGYKQTTDINCGIQGYCKWIKQISME